MICACPDQLPASSTPVARELIAEFIEAVVEDRKKAAGPRGTVVQSGALAITNHVEKPKQD
jgi:hypothetical protein